LNADGLASLHDNVTACSDADVAVIFSTCTAVAAAWAV
jgi:hypothetical protein